MHIIKNIYFNGKGKTSDTYDAIVIGSGVSGSWAAKEFVRKGLKRWYWNVEDW